MTDIKRLQDAMNRLDVEGIVRELFPSPEAERQHVEGERADSRQYVLVCKQCGKHDLDCRCPEAIRYSQASELDADQWDSEFTQAEREGLRILPVDEDDDPLCWSCGEPESEHSGHGSYCPDDRQGKFMRDPEGREPEEFTQADHEVYNAWLDSIYAAEQLEREAREREENRNDH